MLGLIEGIVELGEMSIREEARWEWWENGLREIGMVRGEYGWSMWDEGEYPSTRTELGVVKEDEVGKHKGIDPGRPVGVQTRGKGISFVFEWELGLIKDNMSGNKHSPGGT